MSADITPGRGQGCSGLFGQNFGRYFRGGEQTPTLTPVEAAWLEHYTYLINLYSKVNSPGDLTFEPKPGSLEAEVRNIALSYSRGSYEVYKKRWEKETGLRESD